MENLNRLSAADQVKVFLSGKVKALDLLEACIRQIDKYEEFIHAWACRDFEQARKAAQSLDERFARKERLGPLAGVSVGVKDVFNLDGMPCEMGSPIWKGFTPGNDSRVVHYLRMADAIFPGKTVTAEFAVHAPGPTCNPHHFDYMPGTSSSGSAAAVAAYMVPLALGTQTAGSTIRPASYCGIYGFKPSFGLLPRTGMLKTTDTLDTVGLFSRTVEDIALMFDVVRVQGRDFPIHESKFNDSKLQNKMGSRWKVGIVRGPKSAGWEHYAKQALDEFSKRLSKVKDMEVEELLLPKSFSDAHSIHSTIYDKTLSYYFKEEYQQKTLVSKVMYEVINHGQSITLDDYKNALEAQSNLSHELDRLFEKYDVLLDLSTGGEPLKGLDSVDRPDHCLIWTLCGVPALNLPVFQGPNGLPFGAQLISRRYSDFRLLQFARVLKAQQLIPDGTHPVPKLAMEKAAT